MEQKLREIIQAEAELKGLSYGQIADWLNIRELIPNPVEQGEVPKPLAGVDELFQIVLSSENLEQDLTALRTCAELLKVGKAFSEYCGLNYGGSLLDVVRMLVSVPLFNLSEDTALLTQTRLSETIPDPNYRREIEGPSRAEILGLTGLVTSEKVQEAMLGEVNGDS